MVKNSPVNAGDEREADWIPGLGRSPWRKKWQPDPVFLPGKSHGQRSLVGYSPGGRKESDTTERLSTGAKEFVQSTTAKLDQNPGVLAAQGPSAQRFPS